MLKTLLNQIRTINTDDKIIVTINGEHNGEFDENYRRAMCEMCMSLKNVFPIFFIETRGLSKMWNTIVNTSNDDNVLILNDDLEINNEFLFTEIKSHINSSNFKGFTRINGSFSHFIVNKKFLNMLGYFDERLLGFGEEDGDIVYRIINSGHQLQDINLNGIKNIVSDIRHDHITSGIGKYSKFNRDYIYGDKYQNNGSGVIKGMFDTPMVQILTDINAYPLEKFFMDNKHKL